MAQYLLFAVSFFIVRMGLSIVGLVGRSLTIRFSPSLFRCLTFGFVGRIMPKFGLLPGILARLLAPGSTTVFLSSF
jgi:hypothetical protein